MSPTIRFEGLLRHQKKSGSGDRILQEAASAVRLVMHGQKMEDFFKFWTMDLSVAIEAVAAVVIGIAALEATFQALSIFLRRNAPEEWKEQTRLRLGRWLALALEFELAADILRTAVAPTWNDIGQLAAIVVLRTVLNYFLQKEIDQAAKSPWRPSSGAAMGVGGGVGAGAGGSGKRDVAA